MEETGARDLDEEPVPESGGSPVRTPSGPPAATIPILRGRRTLGPGAMILDDKCVILHMPKTGGVFIRLLLEKHYGDQVRLASGKTFDDRSVRWAQHHSLDEVPPEKGHLPVFGVVRNPWDWYVSWYHFFMSYPHRPPHFITVSQDKTLAFPDFMENLYRYPADSEEYIDNSFSAKYFHIFSCTPDHPRNDQVEMGRYETIHADLHRFLKRVGVTPECLDDIAGFRRMNPSAHRHFSTYYTDSVASQVYEHNRAVIDEYGYKLESG